jgi:3-oxoadipate enol-lactonase
LKPCETDARLGEPAQTRHYVLPPKGSEAMDKVEIRPGVTVAYEDDWFGPPWTVPETVVMVHGNSESSRAWTCWVPHLAGRYRVIRLDLPGFGASSEPPGYGWSAPELAADIGRFLDALGIARCHLIGAKYGGSACMQLASDQPGRLLSLCLFGSPVRGSGSGNADLIRAKGVRQWATETMRSRLGSAASEAQMRWWADELMGKTNPRAAFGASAARIDMELEQKLSLITAPTLIVTTQESGLQSVAAVEQYARRIPDARVLVLPGDSYHIAAVEPELCARHALVFMAQASAGEVTRAAE